MGLPELRKELHEYIDNADESILKMIYAMSKEPERTVIVGYKMVHQLHNKSSGTG